MADASGHDADAAVRRLRRIEVLVVSDDEAFVRTATERLRREGFLVDAVGADPPLHERLRRSCPDVVLLDHAGSLSETLHAVVAVEASHPEVAVVVASETHDAVGMLEVPLVPRWSPGRRLAETVERAHLRWRGSGEVPADAV